MSNHEQQLVDHLLKRIDQASLNVQTLFTQGSSQVLVRTRLFELLCLIQDLDDIKKNSLSQNSLRNLYSNKLERAYRVAAYIAPKVAERNWSDVGSLAIDIMSQVSSFSD